jgi:hypothetical protein
MLVVLVLMATGEKRRKINIMNTGAAAACSALLRYWG